MIKLSPQKSKLVTTTILACFILSAFFLSGFTISTFDDRTDQLLPPNQGPGNVRNLSDAVNLPPLESEAIPPARPNLDGGQGEVGQAEAGSAPPGGGAAATGAVNVIRNGGFEDQANSFGGGVAADWVPYSNGRAWFGWYDEQWLEAVRTGEHAQLMEIFQVEADVLDRVIAIYQTVNVVPNANYDLTIYAMMRTQAQEADRDASEFAMEWGIDPRGEGNHDNVEVWNPMPLTEQSRLGSTGEYPDDKPLFYETITGTVFTGDSNRISLFIRGVKKFPNGTEVNFDVDDVSLVGPSSAGGSPPPIELGQVTSQPAGTTATAPAATIPASGGILPDPMSIGALLMSGLVLIALGGGAIAGLLRHNRRSI